MNSLFSNEVSYTISEFLNEEAKFVKEIELRNNNIKKIIIPAATATGMAITAIIIISSKEVVVPVSMINTLVCSTSSVIPSKGLDVFNELVMQALNKLFSVTCLGGLVVESIQNKDWNDKSKFTSGLTKYSLTYAGGLFILYTLAQIKTL